MSSPTTAGTFSESLAERLGIGPTSCTAVGQNETSRTPFRPTALLRHGTGRPGRSRPRRTLRGLSKPHCSGRPVSGHSCTATGQATPAGDTSQTVIESTPIVRPGYRFVASDGVCLQLRWRQLQRLAWGTGAQQAHRRHGIHARRRRLLVGGLQWRCLLLRRRRVLRIDRRERPSTSPSSVWHPRPTAAATGWWPPTAGCSPTVMPSSSNHRKISLLNQPIVGMAATPERSGLLAGGLGRRGVLHSVTPSSTAPPGPSPSRKPVVGMSASPSGNGYWLVASDGGVFSFG